MELYITWMGYSMEILKITGIALMPQFVFQITVKWRGIEGIVLQFLEFATAE